LLARFVPATSVILVFMEKTDARPFDYRHVDAAEQIMTRRDSPVVSMRCIESGSDA